MKTDFALLAALFCLASPGPAAEPLELVRQVQRADYEGDRVALERLQKELEPLTAGGPLAAQMGYWRGFALWRRAINGFNEKPLPADLAADLRKAAEVFQEAAKLDPESVEAKIGALSCLGFLFYSLGQQDPQHPQIRELLPLARRLRQETAAAAENPRLRWVLGPSLWNTPADKGGGPARAIENYEKALAALRTQPAPADPLAPVWGEPELHMSLAWSLLNKPEPELAAAERAARTALKLVPYWHYVRDILLPQIEAAKAKK